MERQWQPKPPPPPPKERLMDKPEVWERWCHEVYRLLDELYRQLLALMNKPPRSP